MAMSTHRDYFLRRAEEEDAIAAQCANESAKVAHERLAKIYRETALNSPSLEDYQVGSSELFIL